MEYFPRIHHIAALLQSPRVHVKNDHTTRRFHWTFYLHVDVQRWDQKKLSKNANQALSSFRFMQKDFHQEDGHSLDLDQKRSGILLLNVNHKERCRADDVKIRRKQTPSLQIHKSIVSRSFQKQRWWKILNTLLR